MTPQPTEWSVRELWTPDPARQRLANVTVEDVLTPPDDAPRMVLRDGVMIEVPTVCAASDTILEYQRRQRSDMPSLEDRVAALEARVEELSAETRHGTDLAVTAAREALTARDAHQKNIELLNALRRTQAEHSQTLAGHSHTLAGHSQTLAEHGQRLEAIDGKLGMLTVGVHTIESLLRRLVNEGGTA